MTKQAAPKKDDSRIVMAIDVGSGITKLQSTDGKVQTMPSVAGRLESGNRPEFGHDDMAVVQLAASDDLWVVGADAESVLPPARREATMHDSWAGSPGWLSILYRNIAAALGARTDSDVHLVTGLPQALFATHHRDLRATLAGEHKFQVGKRQYKVKLNPMLVPQSFGALMHAVETDEDVLNYPTGVIDPGTHTTGYAVLEGGQPQDWRSGGISIGVGALIERLAKYIRDEYGADMSPPVLATIVRTGQARLRGNSVDMQELVNQFAVEAFGPVLERLRTAWGGAADLQVLIAGGGAPVFAPICKRLIPHARLVDNPAEAVVRGMYAYGVRRSA